MKKSILIITQLFLGFFPLLAKTQKQPNLILIMADDMGYECVRSNGGTSYTTPHLDELARTGARFEHCYSQPLCTPSRVKIMTGMSNFRNYVRFGVLDRKQTTFAHLLKKAGYATCIVGKWQLGQEVDSAQHFGFDQSCLWQHTRPARTPDNKDTRYPNPRVEINGKPKDYTNGEYGPDVVTDFLCDFIERNKDRPFLGYYPMILPHDPFRPTPDSKNPNSKDTTKNYQDMVAYVDKMVGKIISKLEALGLRENTLVLFTCDNGTSGSIKSELNGKMVKGGKRLMTDAGTHVPLIANWPGTIPEGQVRTDLVDFSDFLPTLMEATHTDIPKDLKIDGQSFLPQLRGEQGTPREWVHCWYRRGNEKPQQWARTQRYKLYKTGEFYDVSKDHLESNPLQKLDTDQKRIQEMLKGVLHQFSDSYQPEDKKDLLPDAPPTVCKTADRDLFEGNNFSQWTKLNGQPVGKGWTIADGVVFRKGGDKDIITKEKFRDFELSFQWKISEAGNSGIKYRTQGRYGLEYQILDDAKHRDNQIPSHRAGSLYDLIPAPENKPIHAVGEWNHGKIIAQENVIEHWLNGTKIIDLIWGSKEWKEVFGKSKYKDQKGFGSWEGPILLQDHSDPVWFKELHVSRL